MVTVPGSCGELAQGIIDGHEVLITCPISWQSKVTVGFSEKEIVEKINYKSYQAVHLLFKKYNIDKFFSLKIESNLPRGKGMASSSADIAASLKAAADLIGKDITKEEIKEIALAIEPTDGIFLPGIVAFDHVKGGYCDYLGEPPPMTIAVFDCGGEVDTVKFNQRKDLKDLKAKEQLSFLESYELIKEGIKTGNPVLIGKGATISSLANQHILPKKCLEKIILFGNDCGAVGVNVAHSGTVIGILFGEEKVNDLEKCVQLVLNNCTDVSYLGSANMISGGIVNNGR